jgi:DNA-binding transcriptional LysR family regulator
MNRSLAQRTEPLKYARAFLILAEEMHFGRAAARLGMAQPSLSHQIARLETALGFSLFDRSRRSITLTFAGREYYAGMRRTLAMASHTMETASNTADKSARYIRIGFVSAAMFRALPRAAGIFGRHYPFIEPVFLPRTTSRQLEELQLGVIDIGCARGRVDDDAISATVLAKEKLLVALPSNHKLAAQDSIELDELDGMRYVTFPGGQADALADVIDKAWTEAEVRPSETMEADDWPSIISIVRFGAGFSIVPESVSELTMNGVCFRPVAGCDLVSELTVLQRRNETSESVSRFASIISTILSPC